MTRIPAMSNVASIYPDSLHILPMSFLEHGEGIRAGAPEKQQQREARHDVPLFWARSAAVSCLPAPVSYEEAPSLYRDFLHF